MYNLGSMDGLCYSYESLCYKEVKVYMYNKSVCGFKPDIQKPSGYCVSHSIIVNICGSSGSTKEVSAPF